MSYSTPIDKLMYWRGTEWVKYDKDCGTLRLHIDQLIISSDNKILETFNTNGKIKGYYKGDVLILVLCASTQIKKIKFRVLSEIARCAEVLGQHFPVVSHGTQNSNVIACRYRNLNEVLKRAVETMGNTDQTNAGNHQMPPKSNYTDFVKLCLLDPNFPNMVRETQDILDNLHL